MEAYLRLDDVRQQPVDEEHVAPGEASVRDE
jgi:hypothetical protein